MHKRHDTNSRSNQSPNSSCVLGIRFRNGGVIYDFRSTIPLKVGDKCIVEAKNAEEFGIVALTKRIVKKGRTRRPLKRVLRKATEEDLTRVDKNRQLEKEASQLCIEILKKNKLKMSLILASFSFDAQKGKFLFSGEGRLDFKPIIKELADHFKIRIETRQVGMRDSARMLGGCGICGRTICCDSFLKEFQPVSIRMAKDQNLALAPMKISGCCGRLLCCLTYEHQTYKELSKKIPKCGQCVKTDKGNGKVIYRDIIQEKVTVLLEDDERAKFNVNEIEIVRKKEVAKKKDSVTNKEVTNKKVTNKEVVKKKENVRKKEFSRKRNG